jgi:uncharacterized protein
MAEFSVTPEQWENFLCTIFDEWVRNDVGQYYIQLFDATLANWIGEQPGICTLAKICGHAGVMEFNGDVYSCDHFVFPQYKLGNIYSKTLVEMMYGEKQQRFGQAKQDALPTQCKECQYLFACNGRCPKNRFCKTATGESGLNYLCKGYYQFFDHVAPCMDYMKRELMAQRAPANIMEAIRRKEIVQPLHPMDKLKSLIQKPFRCFHLSQTPCTSAFKGEGKVFLLSPAVALFISLSKHPPQREERGFRYV